MFWNAVSPMDSRTEPSSTSKFSSFEHPENANLSITLMLAGILMLVSLEQSANARSPIEVAVEPGANVTLVSP